MRVLYIMGDQRSGSTLADNLLAQLKGTVSIGELRLLKGHYDKVGPGLNWEWKCSCGTQVNQCLFWHEVLELRQGLEVSETKLGKHSKIEDLNAMKRLYHRVAEITNSELIVDSSKNIRQGLIMKRHMKQEMSIIIITKDFIEVAASQYFHRKKKGQRPLPLVIVIVSLIMQMRLRLLVYAGYGVEIKYSDLVCSEKREIWLENIIQHYCLESSKIPDFFRSALASHTIAGTPSRFHDSPIEYKSKKSVFLREIFSKWRL